MSGSPASPTISIGTAYDQTLGFGYSRPRRSRATPARNDAYAWTGLTTSTGIIANGRNQYSAVASITPTYDATAI